ncbi:hypothetical protein BDV96DRAFT_642280 [Lophiotrema nucula]|uniref:Uncharacterized protein n=1 Tax=Lophiotrema nucula TaxID=690887 RepID=A0A6A5ZK74_9PLEO|nr:hypothetical protein BDV96DRAFT_642280 [Lophiotrema nucula]
MAKPNCTSNTLPPGSCGESTEAPGSPHFEPETSQGGVESHSQPYERFDKSPDNNTLPSSPHSQDTDYHLEQHNAKETESLLAEAESEEDKRQEEEDSDYAPTPKKRKRDICAELEDHIGKGEIEVDDVRKDHSDRSRRVSARRLGQSNIISTSGDRLQQLEEMMTQQGKNITSLKHKVSLERRKRKRLEKKLSMLRSRLAIEVDKGLQED